MIDNLRRRPRPHLLFHRVLLFRTGCCVVCVCVIIYVCSIHPHPHLLFHRIVLFRTGCCVVLCCVVWVCVCVGGGYVCSVCVIIHICSIHPHLLFHDGEKCCYKQGVVLCCVCVIIYVGYTPTPTCSSTMELTQDRSPTSKRSSMRRRSPRKRALRGGGERGW